jgi:hypothetical protein
MKNEEIIEQLRGKIDSINYLCSSIVALTKPELADVFLKQTDSIFDKKKNGEKILPYEEGVLAVAEAVLLSLKQVSDAGKIRSLSDDESVQ